MTSMKFIPILFKGAMVNALSTGTKTQTRRKVKPQPRFDRFGDTDANWVEMGGLWHFPYVAPEMSIKCPYGAIGTVLWVRETWAELVEEHRTPTERYVYRAHPAFDYESEIIRQNYIKAGYPYKWKSSMFMPRTACRLFLEITDIKIERLNEIGEADAIAEGIGKEEEPRAKRGYMFQSYATGLATPDPIYSFRTLWESISGKESWIKNPWVWAITFKVIDKPADFPIMEKPAQN